jgi:hypothetical protein
MKAGVNRIQGRNSNYMDFNPDGSTVISSGKSGILINTNEVSTSPITTPSIPSTVIIPNPTKTTGSFETIVDIIPLTSSISPLDIRPTASLIIEDIFATVGDNDVSLIPDEEEVFFQLYDDIEVIPEINLETNIVVDNTQSNTEIPLPKTRISAATFQKAYDQAEKLEPGFKAKLPVQELGNVWQELIQDLGNPTIMHEDSYQCLSFFGAIFKKFDANVMTLGYPKSTDTQRILKLEHKGIEIGTGNPEWGAEPNKLYFIIKHGLIIK